MNEQHFPAMLLKMQQRFQQYIRVARQYVFPRNIVHVATTSRCFAGDISPLAKILKHYPAILLPCPHPEFSVVTSLAKQRNSTLNYSRSVIHINDKHICFSVINIYPVSLLSSHSYCGGKKYMSHDEVLAELLADNSRDF